MVCNRSYKCRISRIFHPKEACVIKNAVSTLHHAICQTTLLFKHRLLEGIDQKTTSPPFPVNVESFERAYQTVVRNSVGGVRISGNHDTIDNRLNECTEWHQSYGRLLDGAHGTPDFSAVQNFSLTPMVGLAARQYIANLATNVRFHFRDYVRRCMRIVVEQKALALWHTKQLPSDAKSFWKRQMRTISDDILLFRTGSDVKCDPCLYAILGRARSKVLPEISSALIQSCLKKKIDPIDKDLDNNSRVMDYLVCMVKMSRFIEAYGQSLLSPIPVKTSFIPSHYTMDTTSLMHLLFDKDRMKRFAKFFEHSVRGGFPIPGFRNKSSMCSALPKLAPGREITSKDEERFMDAIWAYLCKFSGAARRHRPLRVSCNHPHLKFDHSISTDGYSVSFLVTDRDVRCKKTYKAIGCKGFVGAGSEFPTLSRDTVGDLQCLLDKSAVTLVGGDPGKQTLLRLVGRFCGAESRQTLRYTKKQRDSDTHAFQRHQRCRHGSRFAKDAQNSMRSL